MLVELYREDGTRETHNHWVRGRICGRRSSTHISDRKLCEGDKFTLLAPYAVSETVYETVVVDGHRAMAQAIVTRRHVVRKIA